jgi:hypothetical protein
MSDADLQIRVSVDASGVAPGLSAVKAALDGVGPNIQGLAKSFGQTAEKIKSGVSGVADAVGGLKTAGLGGAEALSGLAKASSGITAVAAAIAGLAQAGDKTELAAFVDSQAGKVVVARQTAQAQMQASDEATEHAVHNDDKALEHLKSSTEALASTFAKGLARMAQGTESFAQVMRSVGQQILQDLMQVVDHMVERWAWGVVENVLASTQGQAVLKALGLQTLAAEIANEHTKVLAAVTGAEMQVAAKQAGAAQGLAIDGLASMKEIVNSAATAAAAVFNSVAKIPIVGWALAPPAAAGAFAAVMAFRGLVSSAAGGFDIPSGVNPLTQLHAQEMVLPARIANPMRDMLSDYRGGGSVSGAGSESAVGDTHLHLHMGAGADGPSLQRWFDTHGDKLVNALNAKLRGGATLKLA